MWLYTYSLNTRAVIVSYAETNLMHFFALLFISGFRSLCASPDEENITVDL